MTQPDWEDIQLLMNAFRNGDKEAFRHIYDIYHASLWFFASRLVGNQEEAEDIVADSFLKVWQKREMFNEPLNVRAYLRVITRNACLDYLKQKKRKSVLEEEILCMAEQQDDSYLEASMLKAELLNAALQPMEGMSDKMKEIYKLMYIDGLGTIEVAELLGLSQNTVRVHKKNALDFVKKKLKEMGPPIVLLAVGGYFLIKLIFRQ